MSLIGMVPDDLLDPKRKDDLIVQLMTLDIEPRRKKQALNEWAQMVGAAITVDDYNKLLGIGHPGV